MSARTLLTIFAHPDDETFSSGGTITKCVRSGVEVYSLVATKGEAGLRYGYENDARPLGAIREEELRHAAEILGIREVRYLGYTDGTLEHLPEVELKEKVLREIKDIRPDVILTFEPGGISAHPDHQTMSKVTTGLVEMHGTELGFPIRLFHVGIPHSTASRLPEMVMDGKPHRGIPDEEIDIWSDITEYFDIKKAAIHAHFSQMKDIRRIMSRDPEMLFSEAFVQAWPQHPKATNDFFDNL